MFTYKRTIYLRETDATGVLYFSQLFNLAGEALEMYFSSRSFSVQALIEGGDFLLPVVHAEADFKAPIRVGDEVEIALSLANIGSTSITIEAKIFDKKGMLELGKAKIVHVAISPRSKEPIPLPELLLNHLCLL